MKEVYLFDYETIGDVRKRHSFLSRMGLEEAD